MSKIGEILELMEFTDKIEQDTFLPIDKPLVSLNVLFNEIKESYGESISKEFLEFTLKKGYPHHADLLIEFFKSKNDLFSSVYLKQLVEAKK